MAEGKDDVNKNDPTKPMSNQNKGSGSDTASAAKISAGTSVGNVGSTPKPQSAAGQGSSGPGSSGAGSPGMGASGTGSGAGASGASSGMGSGAGASGAQSSTLASHTSRPLGGQGGPQAGATGANLHGASSQKPAGAQGSSAGSGQQASGQQSSGDQSKGTAEQVQEKASEALEQATDWARDTYERASNWASDAYEHGTRRVGGGRYGQGYGGARTVQNYVAQNPVMVGLVGLAAGLIIGALLPRTRREDETFGEWADEVRNQGMRYAHDMTERGREYVEQAFAGDDPRFSKHESEFNASQRGQGGTARQ
jgi:ElaB/YqjD/DUF883 family membrane-anchored ribosome-binding protein